MGKRPSIYQVLVIVMIAGIGIPALINQNKILKRQEESDRQLSVYHAEMNESIRRSSLASVMGNLLKTVENELDADDKRQLSDETISRIAWLSASLVPEGYSYLDMDAGERKVFSRERGILLMELINMKIDSISFDSIKAKVSFAGADLEKVELIGKDLSGIDLMCANLKEADLLEAKLKGADLRGANLWGASLSNSVMSEIKLNRADLRWAVLNGVDLKRANLNGSYMESIEMRDADLSEAEIQSANLTGAILHGSYFTSSNLNWSNLSKSQMSNANFAKASLLKSNLSGAIVFGADFSEIQLVNAVINNENWISKLESWQVIGAKEILNSYTLVQVESKGNKHLLKKIEGL